MISIKVGLKDCTNVLMGVVTHMNYFITLLRTREHICCFYFFDLDLLTFWQVFIYIKIYSFLGVLNYTMYVYEKKCFR